MLLKTRGIVLRTYKYSETSVIARVFTERQGLLSFMVPGIRSAKNKKGNILQPGQLLEIDIYFREQKNFQRFKEYKADYIALNSLSDIVRSSVLTFVIELTNHLVNEGEINVGLFEYLHDTIIDIDRVPITGVFPLKILLEVSVIMGFKPSNNYSPLNNIFNLQEGAFQGKQYHQKELLTNTASELMHKLLSGETVFEPHERKQLLDDLLLYFQLHIPGFKPLRSQEVLHEVLAG